MGRKSLGDAPAEVVTKYDSEAEELGLSRIEYIRKCIEVGRLVFQSSGEIDIERLRNLSEASGVTSFDSSLETTEGDLTGTILSNLPVDEHRALTKEEVRTAVFGTEDEQREQITEALKQLSQQDKIRPLVDDGYIKTDE
jgi:hypothetical protein